MSLAPAHRRYLLLDGIVNLSSTDSLEVPDIVWSAIAEDHI